MEFEILPATWRDLNSLRQVEQECFPKDAWPLLDLVAVLTLPDVVRLKAAAAGQMVGFIAGEVRRGERLGWITTVGVMAAYRRKGVGAALMAACEAQMEMPVVKLCVRRSNLEAIRLYHNLGYHEDAIWPNYYHDGEDALVLAKKQLLNEDKSFVSSPQSG